MDMNKIKLLLLITPRTYRRPLILFLVAISFGFCIFSIWLYFPANRSDILGWSGYILATLVLAAELAYSVILGKDEEEIIPDFNKVFLRTIEIIKWCSLDPNAELMVTSATPVFGLELEKSQRSQIENLLRGRIANNQRTRLICLDPRPRAPHSTSPLEDFCAALSSSNYTELSFQELLIRARDNLIEFGQLATNRKGIELRIGPEPPYNVILAKKSSGETRGLIYLASTTTLRGKVEVKGLDIDSSQFGAALEQLFEYMWNLERSYNFRVYDQRTHKHILRDCELVGFYKKHQEKFRDVKVENIELRVYKEVFPPDFGLGIPLIIKTIDLVAKRLLEEVTREGLIGVDVGTGSGIFALRLADYCRTVYATDISENAVQNAEYNLKSKQEKNKIFEYEVLLGDLISPIVDKLNNARKLIVVFNQPYYPSPLNIYGTLVPDGGSDIINRFFKSISEVLQHTDGVVIMPYSPIAAEHNPLMFAPRYGLKARVDETHALKDDDVCIIELTRIKS